VQLDLLESPVRKVSCRLGHGMGGCYETDIKRNG
jgi:hypothetical protein